MNNDLFHLLRISLKLLIILLTKVLRKKGTLGKYRWLIRFLHFVYFWTGKLPTLYKAIEVLFIVFTGQKAPAFLSNIWWESEQAFAPIAVAIILAVPSTVSEYLRENTKDCEDANSVRKSKRIAILASILPAIVLSIYYIVVHVMLGDILHS